MLNSLYALVLTDSLHLPTIIGCKTLCCAAVPVLAAVH